ncbi:uncharacterized protein LOC124453627 isoform X2 [Xenia sp. Carnegie-2017]|uniref:uncharacterized protein LOC124453627 isoform X2 n=1 Tax=Xenia sp. Carnegie-2017 TaxID=2897299 RepID=UPI001F0371CF|nr:uncharacterized protein LOC124453627 isoform X2 [Xenia sp. Carnegie-2017]
MASFDEREAEAIASNWVQNLRFRFARMGLNYHNEGNVSQELSEVSTCQVLKDSVKVIGQKQECGFDDNGMCRKSYVSIASNTRKSVEKLSDYDIASARSSLSKVNLKSLREKRINFFEQNNKSRVTNVNGCATESEIPTLDHGFDVKAEIRDTHHRNNGALEESTSNDHRTLFELGSNGESTLEDGDKDNHLYFTRQNAFGSNKFDSDVENVSCPKQEEDLEVNEAGVFSIDIAEYSGANNAHLTQTSKHETEIGDFFDEDSDSDYTVDDPVARHASPRMESHLNWSEFLSMSNATMSPLGQSISPPVPQITGALYHEFVSSEEEMFRSSKKSQTKDGNREKQLHQRPRSFSQPSTPRDCSEMCVMSSVCYCACLDDSCVCGLSHLKDIELSECDFQNCGVNGSSKMDIFSFKCDDVFNMKCSNESVIASGSLSPNNIPQGNTGNFQEVMFCPNCNERNNAAKNFCAHCGSSFFDMRPFSSKMFSLNDGKRDLELHAKLRNNNRHETSNPNPESNFIQNKSFVVQKGNIKSDIRKTNVHQKQNGRRWEKSNLAWTTYKNSHLSKPSSINQETRVSAKGKKYSKQANEASRPVSCKKFDRQLDSVALTGINPGSLPKSYKFQEFKKKKANVLDEVVDGLTLKGIKAAKKSMNDNKFREKVAKSKLDCHVIQSTSNESTSYLCLPDEIILRILCHLSHSDLVKCSLVCRQLQRISQDEILWRTIVLTRNHSINDETMEKIGAKKPISLSFIKCRGNDVTANGLRELFRRCAASLQELNFIGCNGGQLIGESILLHVALRCNRLRSVDASWSNVGDNGVEALVLNVERLESLSLNGCQAITDRSLKVVADKHGKSLRCFEIFGCFNVSASAIKRLGQKCLNLQTLNLGQCHKITSADIGRLVSHLGSIVNLDLRGCKKARDACVKTIVEHCPYLVNLVLANCPLITDESMSVIATNLTTVRYLDVCGCVKVTDNGVKALAHSCNRLNSLDLSSTSITKKSVMLLANYCSQNLQSLKLSFCVDVTDESVSRLVKHCKRMKILHLYGCKRLRNLKALQKLNKSLKLEF